MNIFDQLQDNAFNVVTTTMGYPATWQPKAGGPEQSGRVLFNDPSEKQEKAGVDYEVEQTFIEWKKGEFPGLAESTADNGMESISISGVGDVILLSMKGIFDGKTYKATVQVV